ncbi:MAG: molybdate ABC transporter permease subunit [Pseudomonadales bacterium]|nr:molybdate ABC transporter permease subunit [Pseudomonadales bacterium]
MAEMLPALGLTMRLAGVTALLLLFAGTPLAWWLARTRSAARPVVEAITALPLVLPPTVLGFYLLLLFSPTSPFGGFWVAVTGSTLTFSFTGLVLASMVYSLPFMVQPLQAAFESVDDELLNAAASLGASPLDRFFSVVCPLSVRGFLNGVILTFAHTVGEFGVVLMVGGSLPGETRVVSIALYEYVETMRLDAAHQLAGILLAFSVLVLVIVYTLNRRYRMRIA